MEQERKLSRSERAALRDDAIKTKMAELDDTAAKPFRRIFKKIRRVKAKIDSIETEINIDCRKPSDVYDGAVDPRFDTDCWVMKKTLEQYKEVEIESLGSVSLKVTELTYKGKEITKYLEISPVAFFRKMRYGILRNHKKPCIRNGYLPQTTMLKLFMANQRVKGSDDEDEEKNTSSNVGKKSSGKKNLKRKQDVGGGAKKKNTDKELLVLIATMESELLSEIRDTKIRLFLAKAKCLELGLEVEM
jgi:hypothetical protein